MVIKFRISLTCTRLREAMVNDLTEGPRGGFTPPRGPQGLEETVDGVGGVP